MNGLPTKWRWATIGDVAKVSGGLTKNATKRDASKIRAPLVSVAAVHLRRIDIAAVGEVGLLDSDGDRATLSAGDLLLVEGNGSLEHIGRVALWNNEIPDARHQNHIIRVRPHELAPRFVLEWLASPAGREAIVREATSAAGLYTLSLSKVERLPIPVPPPNQQRRIVAKLEALQARSRRAREALDAVPPLLEKLRQSVLAAAFRGDLTKDWRAKHKDVEPASELLKRIRVERRKKWEEGELAKMKAKGKAPADDKWKGRYKEPAPVDTAGLPELPEGWCWASVEELAVRVTDGTHQSPEFSESGVPFIVIANIIGGRIDWPSVTKWVSQTTYEENTARCVPGRGDVLYTAVGSYGVALTVDTDQQFMFQRHIAHIKPLANVIRSDVFALLLNAPQSKTRADAVARGVAQKTVTLGELSRFPIPVAPLAEQECLVTAASRLLHAIQYQIEVVFDTAAKLVSLERSALAKAFRGELVPQNPNDEPAEAMLARGADNTKGAGEPRGAGRRKGNVGTSVEEGG